MPAKRYKVTLSAEERQILEHLTTTGKTAAYKMNRARILLKADEHHADGGWGDQAISAALDVSVVMIERVRHQCVEEGFEAVLSYDRRCPLSRCPENCSGARPTQHSSSRLTIQSISSC